MAIPGHELVRAHFSNNERTIVEAFWTDGEVERVEYIEAKEGDPNWENLLTHIDIDDLHEATYKHIKQQHEAFEASVVKIARARGMIYDFDESHTDVFKAFVQVMFGKFDPERDKEKLFLYKLQLFEAEAIKSSKNSAKKKQLRQAASMIDATKIALSMIKS